MKKPPYKAYKKKEKKKAEKHIDIPEAIDTPEAEIMADDIYKLINFINEHKIKIVSFVGAVLVGLGGFFAYKWHKEGLELKAAAIFDRGMFALENGNIKEAEKYFKEVADKYGQAPSGTAGTFLYGKLSNNTVYLSKAENSKSITISPAAKLDQGVIKIEESKINEALNTFSSLKRDKDWTYPAGLYYTAVAYIKENNYEKAKNAFNILKGDYPNSFYTALLGELLK